MKITVNYEKNEMSSAVEFARTVTNIIAENGCPMTEDIKRAMEARFADLIEGNVHEVQDSVYCGIKIDGRSIDIEINPEYFADTMTMFNDIMYDFAPMINVIRGLYGMCKTICEKVRSNVHALGQKWSKTEENSKDYVVKSVFDENASSMYFIVGRVSRFGKIVPVHAETTESGRIGKAIVEDAMEHAKHADKEWWGDLKTMTYAEAKDSVERCLRIDNAVKDIQSKEEKMKNNGDC